MKCAVIVGGVDMMTQSLALAKKPHIVIGEGNEAAVASALYFSSLSIPTASIKWI